jgi:sulfur carrier protein ThiS
MRITLKLFATLGQYLPAEARSNTVEIDVPEGATAHQVLGQFGIPPEKAHLVLLNGVYLDARARDEPRIQSHDALAVWPPVAGG